MKVSLLQDNDYISEKYRNMKNTFKFETVVDRAFFTSREKELQSIGQLWRKWKPFGVNLSAEIREI